MTATMAAAWAAAVEQTPVVMSWPAALVAVVSILAGVAMQIANLVMTHRVRRSADQLAAETQPTDGVPLDRTQRDSTQRDEISQVRSMLEQHVTDEAARWEALEARLPPPATT